MLIVYYPKLNFYQVNYSDILEYNLFDIEKNNNL